MAQVSAPITCSSSTTTGAIRCGMPLKFTSSTILGSIIKSCNVSGVCLKSRAAMMLLMHTDLPDPVAPAMSRWGMAARSAATGAPETLRPMAIRNGDFSRRKACDSITLRNDTCEISPLGTSMPMTGRPGMGASMRTEDAARANARSSARAVILLTLTLRRVTFPARSLRSVYPGFTPNWVIAGPELISTTRAGTPKLASVSSMTLALARASAALKFWSSSLRKSVRGGGFSFRFRGRGLRRLVLAGACVAGATFGAGVAFCPGTFARASSAAGVTADPGLAGCAGGLGAAMVSAGDGGAISSSNSGSRKARRRWARFAALSARCSSQFPICVDVMSNARIMPMPVKTSKMTRLPKTPKWSIRTLSKAQPTTPPPCP